MLKKKRKNPEPPSPEPVLNYCSASTGGWPVTAAISGSTDAKWNPWARLPLQHATGGSSPADANVKRRT